MTEWGFSVIGASCHSGGGGSTKEGIRRHWAPHIRFFAYELGSSWVSVTLLMWPRPLRQPQSAGSPVLGAPASPLGLRSSPSCCIVSCFCISAHFSLTAPPLPLLALLQLGPPQKLSSRPSLDVTSPKRSLLTPPISLGGTSVDVLATSLTPLHSSLRPCLPSSLSTRTVSWWHLCPRLVGSSLRNEYPRTCCQGPETA